MPRFISCKVEMNKMKYCKKCNQSFSDKLKECPACKGKLVKLSY